MAVGIDDETEVAIGAVTEAEIEVVIEVATEDVTREAIQEVTREEEVILDQKTTQEVIHVTEVTHVIEIDQEIVATETQETEATLDHVIIPDTVVQNLDLDRLCLPIDPDLRLKNEPLLTTSTTTVITQAITNRNLDLDRLLRMEDRQDRLKQTVVRL